MQNTDVDNTKIANVKLIALQEDVGGYITYVFENIDSINSYDKYIMCVRFPNWNCEFIEIGDIGFLKYKFVKAGEDYWYDKVNNRKEPYKFTDCHFINFIRSNKLKDIIL